MQNNNFGDILKTLIKNTKVSSKEIAGFLSYDASSVSKWINNKNKPSTDELDYVISKLSSLFSKALYKDSNMMVDMFKSQYRNLVLTKYHLEEFLKSMLYYSYNNDSTQTTFSNVFTESGYHDIVDRTDYIITRNIYKKNGADKHIDFYISFNPFDFYDNDRFFLSPGVIMATDKIVNTHLLISDEFLNHIIDSVKNNTKISVTSILSKLYLSIIFNTNIYHSKSEYYDSFVYIKDSAIIYYKVDSFGKPFLMGSYDDNIVIKEVNNICTPLFIDENIIYKSTGVKNTYLNFFIYSLVNKSPIIMIINHLVFYFMEDEWLKNIADINNIDMDKFSDIITIRDILNDILERGTKITLIIDFENLFAHINRKDIWIDDVKVKINKKLILEYMKHIASLVEKYPNLEIYQKNDLKILRGVEMHSINTLFSKSIILTKKIPSSIFPVENLYGYLNSSSSKKIADYGFGLIESIPSVLKIDKASLLYITRLHLKL